MYQRIYAAYSRLNNGDRAELRRSNLKNLADTPAYFRVLKMTGLPDNRQTTRVLFVLAGIDIENNEEESRTVPQALHKAGVKEMHIVQISRSGDNGIEYLKRQLVRCKKVSLESVGKLAQFWGDTARRSLLKEFILTQPD